MVNRLVSVDDSFNLPPSVNVTDGNLPERLSEPSLSATTAQAIEDAATDPEGVLPATFAPVTEYGGKAVAIQALTSRPFGMGDLHASPPTVTHSATAPITGQTHGFDSGLVRPLHMNPALFNSGGDKRWVNAGVGVSGITGAFNNNYAPWGFQVDLYGTDLAFRWRASPAAVCRYQIFVDGKPLSAGQETPTGVTLTIGGVYYTRIQFTGTARRRITVVMSDMALYELLVPATAQLTAPEATDLQYKIACYGASFTNRNDTSMYGLRLGKWPMLMAKMLGVQVLQSGLESTGYTVGTSPYTDPLRISAVVQWKPDAIIIEGSGNDDGASPAAVTAAATTLYASLHTQLPGVPVIVIGAMPRGDAGSLSNERADNIAAVKAAADAAPNVIAFIDPVGTTRTMTAYTAGANYAVGARVTYQGGVYECITAVTTAAAAPAPNSWKLVSWFTGTGNVTTPTGDGSRDILTGDDDLHPTAAGQEVFAINIAREARKALTAWANGS